MAKTREAEPWVELDALRAALEGGLARGYALRGEERYFRERSIDALRARAEALGYEVCLHQAQREREAGDFDLARLIDDLSGGGLFAARRLIVVRNPGDLLKKDEGSDSTLTRAALAFLKSGEDAGTLVLAEPSLRADHALVKAILAVGGLAPAFRRLYESPPPWKPDPLGSELVRWTLRRARELGLGLTGEQALYLSAATGNDLDALDDQLQVLHASGGKELRTIVPWTASSTPWAVADHLLDGDPARALFGVESLFRGGFQEKSGKRLLDAQGLATMLLASLTRGARAALEVASGGAPPPGSPTQRQAAQARAERRGVAAWRGILEDLADLERGLKSGARIDGNEFARLSLRWALKREPRPATRARAGVSR